MISINQDIVLCLILVVAAGFGFWFERTKWGSRFSGAVVTLGVTFLFSNLGMISVEARAYDLVWSWLVPLAIPMLLFQADLGRIFREAGAHPLRPSL